MLGITDCNPNINITDTPYLKSGKSNLTQEKHQREITDFTKAIEMNPQNFKNYIKHGLSYARSEDYPSAIANLQEAIYLLQETSKEEEAKKLLIRLATLRKS